MSDDRQRQEGATTPDLSRPVTTSDDSEYSLSVEDALTFYDKAGLPRNLRSVQRYCANGSLDAHLIETPFGQKFLITPASVERHIAYIKEVRPVATGRGLSRQAATANAIENNGESAREESRTVDEGQRQPATSPDLSRPVAADTRIVELLERENDFLRGQVAVKDEQIKELGERVRETNLLTGGLQKLLTPLLRGGAAARHSDGARTYDADDLDDRSAGGG